jgi:hypothetical protein
METGWDIRPPGLEENLESQVAMPAWADRARDALLVKRYFARQAPNGT